MSDKNEEITGVDEAYKYPEITIQRMGSQYLVLSDGHPIRNVVDYEVTATGKGDMEITLKIKHQSDLVIMYSQASSQEQPSSEE